MHFKAINAINKWASCDLALGMIPPSPKAEAWVPHNQRSQGQWLSQAPGLALGIRQAANVVGRGCGPKSNFLSQIGQAFGVHRRGPPSSLGPDLWLLLHRVPRTSNRGLYPLAGQSNRMQVPEVSSEGTAWSKFWKIWIPGTPFSSWSPIFLHKTHPFLN